MRRLVLALVCMLVALLATAPASARVVPVNASAMTASRPADSRLGLNGEIAYYTYCFSLREPRLASRNSVVGLRRASDPTLRWKGRPRQVFGGTEVYDMRARQWVPEMGAFLSIDELAYQDARSTLWGWPRQNPVRYRDPSGRLPMDGSTTDRAIGAHQDWNDSNFQSGVTTGGALGALLDLHVVAPALAYIIDAGLFISSGRELPLLGLGGNPMRAKAPPGRNMAGDCREMAKRPALDYGEGQLIEAVPVGAEKFPNGWGFHVAHEMPSGEIIDAKLGATFESEAAWRRAFAGDAEALVSRSPYPTPPHGPPLPGDGL